MQVKEYKKLGISGSFMVGGLLCYFHWKAMLISYLSKIVISIPFSNMQELYNSDYQVSTLAGSSYIDAFKYGNNLWQLIFKEKLEKVDQDCISPKDCRSWLLQDAKNALYFSFNSIS